MNNPATTTGGPRGRGRPRKSASDHAASKARVLVAARAVYAEGGEQALTVARIIAAAGIARPTFYRWFSSREALVEQLVRGANDELLQRVVTAMTADSDMDGVLDHTLDAYLEWGRENGGVVASIYRDMHQPGSIAARIRGQTVQRVIEIILQIARSDGVTVDPLYVEAVLIGIEHIGSRLFSQPEVDAETAVAHRTAMRDLLHAAMQYARSG